MDVHEVLELARFARNNLCFNGNTVAGCLIGNFQLDEVIAELEKMADAAGNVEQQAKARHAE